MARVLVIYGTTEGHTAKICRMIGDELRAKGLDVDIVEAGSANVRPGDYCGTLVAASVHGGRYQRAVGRWVRTHVQDLAHTPSAFVSVCLGVLQKEPKVQAAVTANEQRFLAATGWNPSMKASVAGALLYTRYNWLKRWIMKQIVRQAGGDTDTTRDYEYTDWTDMKRFADTFARLVRAA